MKVTTILMFVGLCVLLLFVPCCENGDLGSSDYELDSNGEICEGDESGRAS